MSFARLTTLTLVVTASGLSGMVAGALGPPDWLAPPLVRHTAPGKAVSQPMPPAPKPIPYPPQPPQASRISDAPPGFVFVVRNDDPAFAPLPMPVESVAAETLAPAAAPAAKKKARPRLFTAAAPRSDLPTAPPPPAVPVHPVEQFRLPAPDRRTGSEWATRVSYSDTVIR